MTSATPVTESGLRAQLSEVARRGLIEDLGEALDAAADVTTSATIPSGLRGRAVVVAKASGVVCGLASLSACFDLLGGAEVHLTRADGDAVEPGDELASVDGTVAILLAGERTALNLIGHLSGIATAARKLASAAPNVKIVDTRKTLPGMRALQKYAVACGGASNHRFSLTDAILIKDTHVASAGSAAEATRRAKAASSLPVQVECSSAQDVTGALNAGADSLLLDNQSPEPLTELVKLAHSIRPDISIEASGGISAATLESVAATGVDRISVGALTHSVTALDVSMRIVETMDA